jgi:hypothetical protein
MEAECLGACGFPTAVQINSKYYENVAAEDVPRLVESLRSRARERARDFAAVPSEILRTVDIASGNGHAASHDQSRKEVP